MDEFGNPTPPVRPRPGPAKTIGTLNIVFGSLLLLCGLCSFGWLALAPYWEEAFGGQQEQMRMSMEQDRAKQLERLQKQQEEAKTETEKSRLRNQREKLESKPVPRMPTTEEMYALDNPWVQTFFWGDIVGSMILNAALFVSGLGLLNLTSWGRSWAVWVAVLKLVLLVGFTGIFLLKIVPIWTESFGVFFDQMGAFSGGGMPPQAQSQMKAMLSIQMTVYGIGMLVIGVIYPSITLYYLTRPNVKAACQ